MLSVEYLVTVDIYTSHKKETAGAQTQKNFLSVLSLRFCIFYPARSKELYHEGYPQPQAALLNFTFSVLHFTTCPQTNTLSQSRTHIFFDKLGF